MQLEMLRQSKLTRSDYIWSGILFAAILFTAAEAPYSFTFNTKLQTWQLWSDLIVSAIFSADLFLHIKKHMQKKGLTALRPKNKYKFYAGVMIDLMSTIPYDIIFWATGMGGANHMIKLVRLFRLVRIAKIFSILNKLTLIPKSVKVGMIFFGSLIVIHWFTCFWVMFNPPTPGRDQMDYYVECFYWSVTTLTTVGYGDITPKTTPARLYTMVVMLVGVGVYGLVIGNISRIFAETARYKEQTREKFSELSAFMKHYHIPERLQSSVFNYYNHLYSKRLSDNDQKIISDLPQALKFELQIYMSMKLIRNLPVFKYCSQPCLKAISGALEQKNFGPGDTIIRIGEMGDEMYIIGHGVVEIILKDGSVVANLHEGQFFGEAALLKETTRNANVRANTYCDLYRLGKADFLEIIKSYPELLENMENITKRRSTDRDDDKNEPEKRSA
jgi:hypothetical protein